MPKASSIPKMRTAADPRGGGARVHSPPRLRPKNSERDLKHTHLQTPFCTPECAKAHLQQSRISKFSGEDPRTPSSRGGEGRGGEGSRGEGGEREGKEGRGG